MLALDEYGKTLPSQQGLEALDQTEAKSSSQQYKRLQGVGCYMLNGNIRLQNA
jgi:hypothetical protein